MPVPIAPPLNGRRVAEFYCATEVAKRTVLRAYAKPPDEQEARIILYDPIRKVLPDYFRSGRESAVLDRVAEQLKTREFSTRAFTETWYKANSSALAALRDLDLHGMLSDVGTERTAVAASIVRIISTVDFFAMFTPKQGKPRRVAVIVNPSGVTVRTEKRSIWINIESEVACRAAGEHKIEIAEIMYVDLRKGDVKRYVGPKKRMWDEIVATCERIVRDWREIRLEQQRRQEPGTA
jgi:hypothetical protein